MNNEFLTGLNKDLEQMALDDSNMLKDVGVKTNRQRNLIFYLDNFLDDICSELNIPIPEGRMSIITSAYNILKNKNDVDLLDIRKAISFALGIKTKKVAYPNDGVDFSREPLRDLKKWIHTFGEILELKRLGETEAMSKLTKTWDPMEKLQFEQWIKYYQNHDHEKYADFNESIDKPADEFQDSLNFSDMVQPIQKKRKRQEDLSPLEHRRRFLSRIDSAKKALRFLGPPVMPKQTWNWMYESLSKLEREVAGLQTVSTMKDAIIRTANVWNINGFRKHASGLLKTALPSNDVTKQIEKALTGETSGSDLNNMMGGGDMPPLPDNIDMGPETSSPFDMPAETGDIAAAPPSTEKEDVSLEQENSSSEEMNPPPLPEEPKIDITDEKPEKISNNENPYSDATVDDVINIFDSFITKITERKQIRDLSKADMMMGSLGIASYFPELGEVMVKQIESDTYISSRLGKIVGKLKGSVKPKNEKQLPSLEMEVETETKPEEEMLNVSSPSEEAPVSTPSEESVSSPPSEMTQTELPEALNEGK